MKLLISHCGGHSLTEALYCGKPVVGLPIFGDQFDLCLKMEKMGFGIYSSDSDFELLRGDIARILYN